MKKALFLDRDGVINIEKNYLYKINDFEFIEGIFELCRHYQKLGYMIFVITNQSGIARGYYSINDFQELSSWMEKKFIENNIKIKKIYFCPHHPDHTKECSCRKPKPGMILQARDEFNLDIESSILVGDKESDIEAGIKAGIKELYLFDTANNVNSSKATAIIHNLSEVWKKKC